MPGNNSTVTWNGSANAPGGVSPGSVRIEQGPDWLVDLYLTPPGWVNPVLKLVAVVVLVVVLYRLYQWDGEVPLDVQREMQIIAGTVVAIVTTTLAFVNLASLPYWVDVIGGFVTGYGVVFAVQTPGVASRIPGPSRPVERVAAAWLLIGAAALVVPELVETRGVGVSLLKGRMVVTGIAAVMLFLNADALTDDPGNEAGG